jgi:alpha-galactosidase
MKIENGKARDVQICYIGGGSRGWAWNLMSDLWLEDSLSGTVKLYDIDREAAAINEQIGNRMSGMVGARGDWRYRAADSLPEALVGADFVIISILPAAFEEMASDVHAPEQYGIYQSVGDTTGPGGLMRAIRTIPMYREIALAIQAFAPTAWVINYTNPMALCVGALFNVFPQIKAFGCCHEVFGIQRVLALAIKEALSEEAARDDIRVNVLGLNHFTWVDKASFHHTDLMPLYRAFAQRYLAEGICDKVTFPEFSSVNRVKFDAFLRYGVAAAAGDRHLAEFMPWYLESRDSCAGWGFALTPVSWRVARRAELIEKSRRYADGSLAVPVEPSGEEGVRQMKALLGLGDLVTNVNLPNAGQMAGMAAGTVVETNALFRKDEVRPVLAGALPAPLDLLVRRHAANQRAILKAALENDRELAFGAFVNDPLTARLSLADARQLFGEMLANTKAYHSMR